MNGWKTGRFKPVEPSGRKGGYRKIPRGEGKAQVRGFQPALSRFSGKIAMRWHGFILLFLALIGPVSVVAQTVMDDFSLGVMWFAALFLSVVYLVGVEVITGNEIPGRGLAMLLALSPIAYGIVVSFL